MTIEISNIDPANFSSSNARDEEITFSLIGASDDDISNLEILSHADVVFRDKEFSSDYSGSSFSKNENNYNFL